MLDHMDHIAASLKDPSWWFTVFFVGIIVSIFAGFLKDWIAGIASKYLHLFREQRKAKAAEREILFEALASNETFLILSMVRLLGGVIIAFVMLGIYMSLPAFLEMKEILCDIASKADPCKSPYLTAAKIYISVNGALAMFINYRSASRFLLVMKGFRRYRRRNNLPRVV